MRGNNEFVYRTFVFQSVFHNINVSYARFKHLLKDFLLSNNICFRYDKSNPHHYPFSSLPECYVPLHIVLIAYVAFVCVMFVYPKNTHG